MTLRSFQIAIILVFFAFSNVSAMAEKRVALVVGMGQYAHAGKLKNPENDARGVASMLERFGFNVTLATNVSVSDLDRKVDEFAFSLDGADVALFYYAGHGLQYRGQNFLVPVDAALASEASIQRETLRIGYVIERMEEVSPLNIVILDACRDNPLANKLNSNLKSSGRSLTLGRGLARMESQRGDSLLVFATAPGDIAADGKGKNSPFTASLLKHMPTPGLEIEVMMKRVKREVRELTSGQQNPETLSRLAKEFVFNRKTAEIRKPTEKPQTVAPPAPKRSEAALVWKDVKDTKSKAVLQAFADQFKGTVYAALAKARLGELQAAAKQEVTPRFNPKAKPSFSCPDYLQIPQSDPSRTAQADIFCMDIDLAAADRRMGDLYSKLLRRLGKSDRAKVVAIQRDWLKSRDHKCRASFDDLKDPAKAKRLADCLLKLTKTQSTKLASWMKRIRPAKTKTKKKPASNWYKY